MSQNVTRITVLHTIVIQSTRVGLGARGGLGSHIKIVDGDGHTGRRHDSDVVVVNVVVRGLGSTAYSYDLKIKLHQKGRCEPTTSLPSDK